MAACMTVAAGTSCRGRKPGTVLDGTKVQLLIGNFNGGYGRVWLDKAVDRFTAKYADYVFENGKKAFRLP